MRIKSHYERVETWKQQKLACQIQRSKSIIKRLWVVGPVLWSTYHSQQGLLRGTRNKESRLSSIYRSLIQRLLDSNWTPKNHDTTEGAQQSKLIKTRKRTNKLLQYPIYYSSLHLNPHSSLLFTLHLVFFSRNHFEFNPLSPISPLPDGRRRFLDTVWFARASPPV